MITTLQSPQRNAQKSTSSWIRLLSPWHSLILTAGVLTVSSFTAAAAHSADFTLVGSELRLRTLAQATPTSQLFTTSFPAVATVSKIHPQALAQVTSGSLTGQLNEASEAFENGSYFNVHTFEGTAGERVLIEMLSTDFDAYLILAEPDGNWIAQDDDSGNGTNSRIVITLPSTGTYQIAAVSYTAGETGQYTLTLQPTEVGNFPQSDSAPQQEAQAISFNNRLNDKYGFLQSIPGNFPDVRITLDPLDENAIADEDAVDNLRLQLGRFHPEVATQLDELASVYFRQNRYEEAEYLLLEAIDIWSKAGNSHMVELANSLDSLGFVYTSTKRYTEAEAVFRRSDELKRKLNENQAWPLLDYGISYDESVVLDLAYRGQLLREQNRLSEAASLYGHLDLLAFSSAVRLI